jgi:hypothetical protein
MKFANIVTNTQINVSHDFNVVESMDEIIHGLPTLIVGFDIADKLYPNYDVGYKKISDNIYWTTKRTENRDKHNFEVEWFKFFVYNELVKDISYIFVDPIQYNKKIILKILKKIYNSPNKISYHHKDMIYIYVDKLIFGVDLKLLKYIGLNDTKIKDKIINFSSVFLRDSDIFIEYKNIIEDLDNQVRFLPFLYSIRNE